ncbi:MAG: hypothetical protein EOM05_10890 [Clostridia bacterium]|nr:hypothetical protein [Clostridia bacterium]
MIHQLPGLIVIIPLLASLAAAASGWVNRKYPFIIAFLALSFTAYASISMLIYTAGGNVLTYHMAGWAPPVGISYKIDGLNALVLTAIQIIALINLPVSNSYVKYGFEKKEAPFYGLYLLFITGLTGITATEDAFNLYVLLEVSSLSQQIKTKLSQVGRRVIRDLWGGRLSCLALNISMILAMFML